MVNRRAKFVQQQKLIVGGIAIVAIGILGYLTTLVLTESSSEGFVEGEHYVLIDDPQRIRGDKIEVMEFFSYGCIHCYNFDDEIEAWAAEHQDIVSFKQTPAVANELWRNYGRAYYTMESLGILEDGHTLMFKQVHDARRNLKSAEDIAGVLAINGVTEEAFIRTFQDRATEQKLVRADQMARRFKVATVPSLVVHGKYHIRVTGSIGFSRMLDVADFLIQKELAEKTDKTLTSTTEL
ncbi:MAG: thiol:disulfide interchange protein DsbA [Candidatus Azotimanducaceae bacterium]|jgi:thiol:disulfide interchange protein DsbA